MSSAITRSVIVALTGLALTAAVSAQQGAAPRVPTEKDPIRFSAFAVNMQGGAAGNINIAIERWTTDEERTNLLELIGTKIDRDGQGKLLNGLQDIKVRTGYIRTNNSLGWDLKYAYQTKLPDGTRQIVVVTDKPVSFFAAANNTRTMDYPFTLIQMHFPPGSDKGEGKLLNQTSISVKDGRLQLEIYGQEPTRLTTITEEKPKNK